MQNKSKKVNDLKKGFYIETARTRLSLLSLTDVTQRYADWLNDSEAKEYIQTAKSLKGLESLREYVASKINRDDVIFLRITDLEKSLHIGNVKFEPVCQDEGYATVGILIGEPKWRGKGIAGEVLNASFEWLFKEFNIRKINLGVAVTNAHAIRSYLKMGFVSSEVKISENSQGSSLEMELNLNKLFNKNLKKSKR